MRPLRGSTLNHRTMVFALLWLTGGEAVSSGWGQLVCRSRACHRTPPGLAWGVPAHGGGPQRTACLEERGRAGMLGSRFLQKAQADSASSDQRRASPGDANGLNRSCCRAGRALRLHSGSSPTPTTCGTTAAMGLPQSLEKLLGRQKLLPRYAPCLL